MDKLFEQLEEAVREFCGTDSYGNTHDGDTLVAVVDDILERIKEGTGPCCPSCDGHACE